MIRTTPGGLLKQWKNQRLTFSHIKRLQHHTLEQECPILLLKDHFLLVQICLIRAGPFALENPGKGIAKLGALDFQRLP